MCRNSFTNEDDDTEDEELHNYDHRLDNDHGEHDEEEDEQQDDWCLVREPVRKLGN